ncbi:MAG: hypothetical protein EP317_02175 [Bacillota bacterium]|nr:MAG: hypothetical protein EP317_02175 [Bacillota bacterium]
MSFLLSIFQALAFVSSYVEWIHTHVVIPLKENVYDYIDLPEAKLYVDGNEVSDHMMFYERNGVQRTFLSTISTSYVRAYTIYYRVTFPTYNLSHTQAITFEIKDFEPPVITFLPNFRITLLQELPSFTEGIKISDNYDEVDDLKVYVNLTHIIKNRIGTYPVEYEVTDTSGNVTRGVSTIEIYDHLPPDVMLKKAIIILYGQTFVYTDFFTIRDNYDLVVDVDIDISLVDFTNIGTYPISLTAKDQSGNEQTFHFDLSIIDTTPPIITLKSQPEPIKVFQEITSELLLSYVLSVTDNYDTLTIFDVFVFHDIDSRRIGTYHIYYHLIDLSGNATEVILKIKVIDDTPPTLIIKEPFIFDVFSPIPHFFNLVDYIDNYDDHVDISLKITVSPKMDVVGFYPIIIEISDLSKNVYIYRGYVEIIDQIPPVIAEIDQIVVTDFQKRAYYSYFDVSDQYTKDEDIEIIIDDSKVDYQKIGVYPITVYAYDLSQNEGVFQTELIILDISPPTITLKFETYIAQIDEPMVDLKSFILEIADNYQEVHLSDVLITHQIDISRMGVYHVVYSLSDASRNEVVAYLEYRIDDARKPQISFSELNIKQHNPFNPMEGVHIFEHSSKVKISCYPYTIDTNIPGTYDIIYIATDERGNATKLIRTISVLPNKEEIEMTSYLPVIAVIAIGASLVFYFYKKL